MATEIRTGIRLDGDASGMKAAFADGEKAVKQLNKDIVAAAKGSGFLGQEMSGAAKSALALGAAVAGWQLGRTIIAVADDMQVLQSRLKLVTSSASEQAFVQQRLFAIAQQSRVSYTELGATYAQIARATSELGISQSRLLGVTQTIGQAMAISGGSAQAMQTAHRAQTILRENLIWAVAYNLVAIPFAAAGLITPLLASIGMAASSLLVVLNSYRLLR